MNPFLIQVIRLLALQIFHASILLALDRELIVVEIFFFYRQFLP